MFTLSKRFSVVLASIVWAVGALILLPSPTYALDACVDGTNLGSRVGAAVVTGTTTTATASLQGTCKTSTAKDIVYQWTAPATGEYSFDTNGSDYDTMLYLLNGTTCTDTELACDDDAGDGTNSLLTATLTAGQTILVVVDGFNTDEGNFILNITPASNVDADQDGFSVDTGDCNEGDITIHPGSTEVPYDNIDQDCNGTDLIDVDGDGQITVFSNDILSWTAFVDTETEYPNTLAALTQYKYDYYTLTESATTDPAVLEQELVGKEVFLISAPENTDSETLKNVATGFNPVLQQFVQNGGTVIVLGEANNGNPEGFLVSSGLMDITKENSYGNNQPNVTITQQDHPIMKDIVSPVNDIDTTTTYTVRNTDAEILATYTDGKAVVATRTMNTGHVALIGFDYASFDDNTAKMLSNALQWSQSNPIDTNDQDYDNDGVETSVDCNDKDANVSANIYKDVDGDGLGDPTTALCAAAQTGYVSNADDLNDADFDNDGAETTADCNDQDDSIQENQTYYQDVDKDGLGNEAAPTTVCSFTAPEGYVTNTDDLDDTIPQVKSTSTVIKIKGAKNGKIAVALQDNTIYHYQVFGANAKGKTSVKRLNDHLVVVVQGKGKAIALVDYLTGEVDSTKQLSTKEYKHTTLRIHTFHNKRVAVVISSGKKSQSRLSTTRIDQTNEQLKDRSSVKIEQHLAPSKTTIKKKQIRLHKQNKNTIATYTLNKQFNLVEQK